MKILKRKYAIIAGLSLLIMAATAAFTYGFVYKNMIVQDDAFTTLQNIANSSTLFLAGITGWILIFICDVFVAWALYYFFKDESKPISLLTALIRILYTLFLVVAISHLIKVSSIVGNISELTASLAANISLHLVKFEKIWSLGLIIFGIHLIGLGYLAIRYFSVPKIWGWLLLFSGVSYFAIHLTKNVMPDFLSQIEIIEMVLSLPMALAEIGFAIWLIVRGGKVITIKVR